MAYGLKASSYDPLSIALISVLPYQFRQIVLLTPLFLQSGAISKDARRTPDDLPILLK